MYYICNAISFMLRMYPFYLYQFELLFYIGFICIHTLQMYEYKYFLLWWTPFNPGQFLSFICRCILTVALITVIKVFTKKWQTNIFKKQMKRNCRFWYSTWHVKNVIKNIRNTYEIYKFQVKRIVLHLMILIRLLFDS